MAFRRSAIDAMENKLYEMLPPIHGTWFFVDPTDGSSTKSGRTRDTAVASLVTAYGKCTTGRGDGIVLLARGITTAGCTSYLSEALDWAKWGITVVGICAPTRFAQRSRVANLSTATGLAYLIDVQGSNNAFYNMHVGNFGSAAGAVGGVKVTGDRNYFENVHMIGGGGHTATANDYDLSLHGNENTFLNCVFGSDTYDKGNNANCNLLLPGGGGNGCMRNWFDHCMFLSYHSSGGTAGAIRSGAGDSINRPLLFDNCTFIAYDDGAVLTETSIVIGTNPNNGYFLFKDCARIGYTDWGAVAASCYTSSPTAHEAGGILQAANPS
jgi:hypothetical protein